MKIDDYREHNLKEDNLISEYNHEHVPKNRSDPKYEDDRRLGFLLATLPFFSFSHTAVDFVAMLIFFRQYWLKSVER